MDPTFVTSSKIGSTCTNTCPSAPLATGSDWYFPQSIASGDPRPKKILLWTRVLPTNISPISPISPIDNIISSPNISIKLRVTKHDNSKRLGTNRHLHGKKVLKTVITAYAKYDYTIRHRINKLTPNTTYYYQFIAGHVRSNVGRFQTAPSKHQSINELKFAYMCCQDWSQNHWGVYSDVINQDIRFIVHLGDYIYETVGSSSDNVESRHPPVQIPNGSSTNGTFYAATLTDYRYLYKLYRSDPRIQAVHEKISMVPIWDDHEFGDDGWGCAEVYSNGIYDPITGGDNSRQPLRRQNANRAWCEYTVADIYDESTSITDPKIYRDLQFGNLAHLVFTDERLYKNDHMVPEAIIDPNTGQEMGYNGTIYFVPQSLLEEKEQWRHKLATPNDPKNKLAGISMLGTSQRKWLKSTLKSSSAIWKFWGNEVMSLRVGLDGVRMIAALITLGAMPTLTTSILSLNESINNIPISVAAIAAITADATPQIAVPAAMAIAVANDRIAAAIASGLTDIQAAVAVASYEAAASNPDNQATIGAWTIANIYIKPDIIVKQDQSKFVIESGMADELNGMFQKFIINADQWDGYNSERKDLMKFILKNNISNVVAITGDVHAFFAGVGMHDYDHPKPIPAMVDLVTAGVSSSSNWSYMVDGFASTLPGIAPIVYYPITITVNGIALLINVNIYDYTLGLKGPTAESLAESCRVRIRGDLGNLGYPEDELDSRASAFIVALASNQEFVDSALSLAQQMADVDNNPWLRWVDTDAQGYSIITITPTELNCEFRKVNRLVGDVAPHQIIANIHRAVVRSGIPDVLVQEVTH